MPENSVQAGNAQRISVVCDCGKKLVANSMPSAKRLKCPSCGKVVDVPPGPAGIVSTQTTAASEPRAAAGSWGLMIGLWLLTTVVAIGGGAFVYFDIKGRQQARIDSASTELREAVREADPLLRQDSEQGGENVEHPLQKAIAAKNESEMSNTDAVLEPADQGREQDELAENSVNDIGAETADGFVPLFNGRDLTGWKMHPTQPGKWRVENGVLIGSEPGWNGRFRATPEYQGATRGSFLYTERDDFTDFHLRVEVLVNDFGGDSGLFFRSPFGPSGAPRPVSPLGYEADIHDGDVGSLFTLDENNSGPTLLRRGNSPKRRGEWVTLEVIAAKNRIGIKVNGATAVDFRDRNSLYTRGHIALQCWERRTEVKFRKIEIKELVGENQLASILPDMPEDHQNDQRTPEETDQYVKQQIQDLESGRRLVGLSNRDIQKREQAVENLKGLGPAAIPAVPALAWAAVSVREKEVKRKAIELLGEIGGLQGVTAICQLLDNRNRAYTQDFDQSIVKVAEDSLLKLLSDVGSNLTMDDAIVLWDAMQSGSLLNKPLSTAIENAWEASGMNPVVMANEILRRCRAKYDTSKGKGINRPAPSPENWFILSRCKLEKSSDGVVNMRLPQKRELWAEENPEEASRESQNAARQMSENEKRLARIRFKGPSEKELERQRVIQRQNDEAAADRVR